ncbi:MAG: UTP--glucose-1-phosphate uridylyltransferase, partial [Bdellovibrionales bacterium]|nr:UTP--glucose-1-phosphate uridylyltransferase [Bdellovibrionales bacterium]
MMKIRKAVIPVAGKGTRFLPATKQIPKEMLPIINTPMIHYAVEEAVSSGVEELIFVTSSGKEAIENYFDRNLELERFLE